MLFSADKKHPKGSVLIFVLGVLILLSLMGAAIMANTRSELKSTVNTIAGRQAFSRADSMATVALQLARVVIVGEAAGTVGDVLDNSKSGSATSPPGPAYMVKFDSAIGNEMDFYQLGSADRVDDILNRYLGATAADEKEEPTVTLLFNDTVIGTAHVATTTVLPAGASLDGKVLYTYIVVSVDGRVPRSAGAGRGGSYFNEYETDTTRSIVSSIYRQIRAINQ